MKNTYTIIKSKQTITVNFDTKKPRLGYDSLDMSTLRTQHKYNSWDPGLKNTAVFESKICYIDGDKGLLTYRGYRIEDLVEHSNFMETTYILLHGHKPKTNELTDFTTKINLHQHRIPNDIITLLAHQSKQSDPTGILLSLMGAIASHMDTLNLKQTNPISSCLPIISIMPTLVANIIRHIQGKSWQSPHADLSFIDNFLYCLNGKKPSEDETFIMDKLCIVQAEHELNASTHNVRATTSTGANLGAALCAGIASLWGPAHGGANQACYDMLLKIGSIDQIPKYIAKAKNKKDPFRLMGFGHRIYRNTDPRAKIFQKMNLNFLKHKHDHDLFSLAIALKDTALSDPYFVDRKLYPNTDFFSGILFHTLGIPSSAFPTLFVMARTVGWCAHWLEMQENPNYPIIRPQQFYTGSKTQNFHTQTKDYKE
ncbi:MAG: citrate/2-methylcitrate synthase [Pseudomonadota bacterium]|nr:citrate/2-methylcitrate synthase [Pseudomonadota bacterium]